ncbi:MAG TPA: S41 family peptidase [Mucilaginibacter sp.]|nr:S41 family peptidase [Mucilaginibacter sp.]
MKNKTLPLLAGCFLLASLTARSQEAMKYYDQIQNTRDKASDLWGKKNPTPEEARQSLRMLRGAISLLDSVPVAELANGNIYLKARRHDLYMDVASAYAVQNKKDSAIYWLYQMFDQGSYSGMVSYLEKDSSFMNLRGDPRFTAFTDLMRRTGDLYKGAAFKTAYKENLSDAEKTAGLSLLWMQARNNFVYFDHLKDDWNKTYMDYIPLVLNTKSTAEYYKVLMQFYAQLHDGHTNVYPPKELQPDFYSRPPMRTELVEGRVFVSQVFSDSLMKTGIVPGLEVISIDSEPVVSYAEKNVRPYQSSSTPQDMEIREFTYALLSGPAKRPITFELKDRSGKTFTKVVSRTGYRNLKYPNSVVYQTIGDVGYLQVNDFESRSINKIIDSLFKNEISKTKGLVIDIRYNGGGDDGIGFNIIRKLINKPVKGSLSKVVKHYGRPGDELNWEENGPWEIGSDGKTYYDKPVVLLVGPRTFSAAEDFTVVFDYMKRGKILGMPTGGSTGQPVSFDLPGGGSARVCGKKDTYPDGKEFVGIGSMPDVIVKKTVKDEQDGVDAAKDKAIAMLK